MAADKRYGFKAFETLVVGSGAAGFNAAVALKKQGVESIAILTEDVNSGTSRNTGSDKQTYYKLTTCGSDGDSVRRMAETLFSGGAMDGDIALAEAAGSLRSFFHLVEIGVPFPFSASGEYVGYKTDHDPLTRGTSVGPLTSHYMTERLEREARALDIPILDGYQVIDILTHEGRARGVVALVVSGEEKGGYVVFAADSIVYATGGEAGMYHASVYPVSQCGGTGAAFRAGVMGKNLTESQYGIASVKFRWNLSGTYQQVLPRYISTDAHGGDEHEFLTDVFPDAQRLLTAVFLKGYQWPFDPRKTFDYGSSLVDLLVYQETVLRGRRVFMDFRRNPSCLEADGVCHFDLLAAETKQYLTLSGALQQTPIDRLRHMNPAAIELYLSHGINLETEPLEIAVCAQHNNGGLSGNRWWESNISHFFPVGEVNGSHGVYRPGGSALNSGQVGSLRAAQYIAGCYRAKPLEHGELEACCGGQIEAAIGFGAAALAREKPLLDLAAQRREIGLRMSAHGAMIRSAQGVQAAVEEACAQEARLHAGGVRDAGELPALYRLRDLLTCQRVYLEAIYDYIQMGGQSRGSYLIADEAGELPAPGLPELFRLRLDGEAHAGQIQEVLFGEEGCRFAWRPVRPVPSEDLWFENVWKSFRDGEIYRMAEGARGHEQGREKG